MGNRRLDLVTLALLLVVGSAVAVLSVREAAASRSALHSRPVQAEPLWLRYLDAGMRAEDVLWSRSAQSSREAYARGDFAHAREAARIAVTTSDSFRSEDPRRAAALALLDRSEQALERSERTVSAAD